MSYLNLMGNKLKPKEVNEALEEGTGSDLPDVGPEDAGQVLTVGDTGEWEADDLPPQLPDVDSTDNGKLLGVSSGAWATVDPPSSGGYNITSTETDTGIKIGGVTVYCKEYELNATTTGSNITGDDILPLFAFAYRAGSKASNNGGQPIAVYRSYEGGIYLGQDVINGFSTVGGKKIVIFYIK